MKTVALIPARGGSKGIPQKNVYPVAGKPLIGWTIELARGCSEISRVIVSTDDQKIADVSLKFNAEVPFLRPAHLASDDTPGIIPVLHAVQWLLNIEKYQFDAVLLLQPTSPLRENQDIETAIDLMAKKDANSIVSVTESPSHPYWTKKIDENGLLLNFLDLDTIPTRRQDLPSAYSLNGAIYLIKVDALCSSRSFYPEKTYGYIMPQERSLDIDTPWDMHLADLVLKERR